MRCFMIGATSFLALVGALALSHCAEAAIRAHQPRQSQQQTAEFAFHNWTTGSVDGSQVAAEEILTWRPRRALQGKLPTINTEPNAEGLPSYAMGGGPNRKTVRLVMWDNVRGRLVWILDPLRKAAEDKCSTRCILSLNRADVPKADGVVFHAMTNHQSNPRLPQKRPPGTKYILVSMEQPKYARMLSMPGSLKPFDYLATYSQETTYVGKPNFPMTYWPLHILSTQAVMTPPLSFAEKDGFTGDVAVAAFVSNCNNAGASTRTAYLEELLKHIKVHMYGKCLHNRNEPSWPYDPTWPSFAQRRANKIRTLRRYKFYLAFENAPVQDYVSEKVYESYMAGSVPVYRGTPGVERFLPSDDSFIDANELSAKELADKIKSYLNDEEAYNRFFDFKKQPVSDRFREVALRSYTHYNILCRICEAVSRDE